MENQKPEALNSDLGSDTDFPAQDREYTFIS